MKRENFLELLDQEYNQIRDLFTIRNKSYGADDDLFYNFRETAERMLPELYRSNPYEAMYKVLMILLDKHMVALTKGLTVNEFQDRSRDVIVYTLIAKCMEADMLSEQKGGTVDGQSRNN